MKSAAPKTVAAALDPQTLELRYRLLREVGELALADLPDEELLRGVTDLIIAASGADGGFLLRLSPGSGKGENADDFEVVLARNYQRGDILKPEFEISRTLIRRVVREQAPVYVEDAGLLSPASLSGSIRKLGVISVIALPLRQASPEAPYAVIYLDRRRRGRLFRPHEVAILSEVLEFANRALAVAFASRAARPAAVSGNPLIRATLIGDSPECAEVGAFIERAAGNEANVLLRGETGTGKDLVAQLLHRLGPAAGQPFVAVNCAAIPVELLESELFGHEAGAFTGARARRIGKFQEAGEGTLLLDEIGDMPPALQAKLLRVVETRRFTVVGGREMPFRARLVAATHQPLEKLIREGRFRQDLFYRLAVLELTLPPLRQRRSDIPLLAAHFVGHFARRQGRVAPALSPAAVKYLVRRPWPGNIRELAHLIERAIVFAEGALLEPRDFKRHEPHAAEDGDRSVLSATAYELARRDLERRYVEGLLAAGHGNVTAAAKVAGLSRARMYQLVKLHFPDLLTAAPRKH